MQRSQNNLSIEVVSILDDIDDEIDANIDLTLKLVDKHDKHRKYQVTERDGVSPHPPLSYLIHPRL